MRRGYIFSDQGAMFGERDCVGFGDDDFCVQTVHRDIANAMILKNHYSKKIVQTATLHLGVILSGKLVGVLQFGVAMNPASCGSVVTGTKINEYLELNRMWLDDCAPRNSESKAISYSVKLIRKVRPDVKWIQSFSDERCGLFGTVYQAAGFSFHGEHVGTFWELDGEWYHKSILDRAEIMPSGRHLKANLNRAVCHKLRQFRYLKFMKPRFSKGCKHPQKPYPKPDYAARLLDEGLPKPVRQAQTLRAAPLTRELSPKPIQEGFDI
jgi:hypothetical protein